MAHVTGGKARLRSRVLKAALRRLAAGIAPLVSAELLVPLAAELERHFSNQLLPDLRQRVAGIAAQELPARIEAVLAREVPERVEAILQRGT